MARPSRSPVYFIALGGFALGMDAYVTAGLIPMIGTAFAVPAGVAAQGVTAFTLAYGIGTPVTVALLPARLQRASLLTALIVFVLANVGTALAPGFTTLLFCRAIAGVGAGVYLATGNAASAALSRPGQKARSIAVIMGGMASGAVLGVPISLLLAERTGWASALWLVAALGGVALIGLLLKLPLLPPVPAVPLRTKLSLLHDGHVVSIVMVSLLAAISSLGTYTFIAPLLAASPLIGPAKSITPYLWAWGVGGVVGSVSIGLLAERVEGPILTLWIMGLLTLALWALPWAADLGVWLPLLPLLVWGAVGWALQVPQNSGLIRARERQGDGNLAVALNGSALYLGSAIGAGAGGWLLLLQWQPGTLAACSGTVALVGALVQAANVRRYVRGERPGRACPQQ